METTIHKQGHCVISWSAIIAGALIAFALSALFNLFNAGLGFVVFPETFHVLTTLTITSYIWLIICGVIAMFIAGYATGKIMRCNSASPCNGFLHGFLAWSLALLLALTLASHFAQTAAQMTAATQVSSNTQSDMASSETPADVSSSSQTTQSSQAVGGATIGLFLIFLFGALAAGLGGYFGVRCSAGREP